MSAVTTGHDPVEAITGDAGQRSRAVRRSLDRAFLALCIAVTAGACVVLTVLLVAIVYQGAGHFSWRFLTSYPSMNPAEAGVKAALWGSVWTCAVCALTAIPLGVGTAIFLEEYKPRSRGLLLGHNFIQLNIANLAGVPSVVYGIIGLTAFARMFGLFGPANVSGYDELLKLRLASGAIVQGISLGEDDDSVSLDNLAGGGEQSIAKHDITSRQTLHASGYDFHLSDGRTVAGKLSGSNAKVLKVFDPATGVVELPRASVVDWSPRLMHEIGSADSPFYMRLPLGGGILAGGLTLMLVVLPVVIVSTREALRSVPSSLREGALAVGATRWQMIWGMVLPASMPGVLTGGILAMSRAIGEAAPILVVSGVVFIMSTPRNLVSDFSAMPLQVYDWVQRPQEEFHQVAAAGIMVLLAVLLVFNGAAVYVRQRMQGRLHG